MVDFNPRSPHGERLGLQLAASQAAQFQPTLPARGATRLIVSSRLARRISTHAPRTGSDEGCSSSAGTSRHFNPRSPHGERRHAARLYDGAVRFQSTLPVRGATGSKRMSTRKQFLFQSTLPARGATSDWPHCPICWKFQSPLPARGATPRFVLFG